MSPMNEVLQTLLEQLEAALRVEGPDVSNVTSRVRDVLNYLNTPENNTHENCVAVDQFVLVRLACDDTVRKLLSHMPESLQQIVQDMGSCLHDTHAEPYIARNFQSTPEQLLKRLNAVS